MKRDKISHLRWLLEGDLPGSHVGGEDPVHHHLGPLLPLETGQLLLTEHALQVPALQTRLIAHYGLDAVKPWPRCLYVRSDLEHVDALPCDDAELVVRGPAEPIVGAHLDRELEGSQCPSRHRHLSVRGQ